MVQKRWGPVDVCCEYSLDFNQQFRIRNTLRSGLITQEAIAYRYKQIQLSYKQLYLCLIGQQKRKDPSVQMHRRKRDRVSSFLSLLFLSAAFQTLEFLELGVCVQSLRNSEILRLRSLCKFRFGVQVACLGPNLSLIVGIKILFSFRSTRGFRFSCLKIGVQRSKLLVRFRFEDLL